MSTDNRINKYIKDDNTNDYQFIPFYKILWENEYYRNSLEFLDIFVYSLLCERYNQFSENINPNFIDDNGERFIYYPEIEIEMKLNKSHNDISNSISKLEKLGLIRKQRIKKYPGKKDNREIINRYYLWDIPKNDEILPEVKEYMKLLTNKKIELSNKRKKVIEKRWNDNKKRKK